MMVALWRKGVWRRQGAGRGCLETGGGEGVGGGVARGRQREERVEARSSLASCKCRFSRFTKSMQSVTVRFVFAWEMGMTQLHKLWSAEQDNRSAVSAQ